MADNTTLNVGTGGDVIASDDIGGVKHQRVKVGWGADGSYGDTSAANPIPTVQTGELPAGTNNIGDVDVLSLPALPAGTNNIGDVDILSVVPGTSATSLGKAEDAAHASGDVGVMALAVRQDAPANLSGTDLDYEPLQVSGGKLWTAPLGFFTTCSTDITRPSDTTAYAVNDALSDSTSAPTSGGFSLVNAVRKSTGSAILTDLIVTSSNDAATPLQGEIFFFSAAVTAINDNAAFAVSDSEIKTCLGKVPFVLEDVGNNGFFHAQNLGIGVKSGGTNLRYLIRVKNAYTPASAEVITIVAKFLQID